MNLVSLPTTDMSTRCKENMYIHREEVKEHCSKEIKPGLRQSKIRSGGIHKKNFERGQWGSVEERTEF